MLTLTRPSRASIERCLADQSPCRYTYAEVGCTQNVTDPTLPQLRERVPTSYAIDRTRALLGSGEGCYLRACESMRSWRMCDVGWASACWPETPIEIGRIVAILARTYGLWSLNVSRIIYVIEDRGDVERFGFAYGTLPHHVERGEERFSIEWDHATDKVWYRITAISQPKHWLVNLAHRLARKTQRRFARDSVCAIRAAANAP